MNRDILFEIIQKCLNIYVDNNSVDKLKEEFHLNKIPFSKINTMKELFEDEFIKELDIIHETSDELKLKYIKNPIQYSSIKSEKLKRPPYLGEHTKEILKELNFSDSEINFLKKERAIYFF